MGRPFVAEYWLYQDGSRILELSTKCTPAEAFQVAAEARAFLIAQGIELTGNQQAEDSDGARVLQGTVGRSGQARQAGLLGSPLLPESRLLGSPQLGRQLSC